MKKIFRLLNVSTLICVILINPVFAKNTPQQTVQQIYSDWCTAIGTAKGNAQAILKYYAPDAVLHPTLSNETLINRDQGLNKYFKKLTSLNDIKCTPKQLITDVYSNIAINTGTYEFSFIDENGTRKEIPARFTFVYKDINHHWLILNHHSSAMPE